jgi:hypothetical protein
LDVYIQQEIPIVGASDTWGLVPTGTAVWDDVAHFTQVTTATGTWIASVVGGGNVAAIKKDAALAAATVRSGPIGSNWRVKYVAVRHTVHVCGYRDPDSLIHPAVISLHLLLELPLVMRPMGYCSANCTSAKLSKAG